MRNLGNTNEREEEPGTLGCFVVVLGALGLIGIIEYSCSREPDWKNMSSPDIIRDNCRLIISDKMQPSKRYVDIPPFGNFDYTIDNGCEREPNSTDRAEFARLRWIAEGQGLLKY